MQFLDIISVNIWDILISLINLLILFLVFKRFLFKPVQKMLDKLAKTNIIHKNKASNLKSSLALHVNALA